jgi:uncharacterized membrane protein YfcA
MTIDTLKYLRFVTPAVIILLFTALFGWITGWWTLEIPDFSKAAYLPVVLIPAAIYYITPLRRWVNAPHHRKINERIRRGMVDIGDHPDRPDVYT